MLRLQSALFLAYLVVRSVAADDFTPPNCSLDEHCPEKYPCCSVYGQCGTGAYCLGGCDPLMSYSLDSCAPMPICESKTYKWENLDNAATNSEYLGNASAADWVYSGEPKIEDGNLVLTMPKESTGSLFANNHYIWYGKIGAKIKSSRGAGVVTAFILLSDTKDEIDYEWVGSDLAEVQTNYYFQGILDYDNGGKSKVDGDNTYADWHTYEIDWTPEKIDWLVDGDVVRTLTKESTFNESADRYEYPQTPSRMQLSLWPAGQASNAQGTIEWAGGEIDWDSEDIKNQGYYAAYYQDVTVECYDPPSGAKIDGDVSYDFKDDKGLESSVEITDNKTVLASLGATGLDMDLGSNKTSSSGNSTGTISNSTVPQNQGGTGNVVGSTSGGGSGSSNTGSSGGTFSQGTEDTTDGGENAAPAERVLKGSFFAVLVAVVVLITM
ncbi:putative cell wall glucanase (Utr2) [Aspergillus mulundensis]|uniref:Crh-like protein n=1 Tax=Aspergillus mulundensis TaxID=1810919 RepID=A0A3D8Q6U9_9EURO|nr:putative transglycosidase, GH16 family [Aspergillus mulundensis]RDW57562.1 putative transglycosidase, GH16 family [Aspergillus mulundensis]